MKFTDYKTSTLARPDVDDIVRIEPVELRPNAEKTGYEIIVQTTESGKTVTKYDVHLMRVVDGVKIFDKEQIAIVDEGKDTEDVVFRAPTTAKEDRIASRLERYINTLPYLDVQDKQIDPAAKSARFTALKDNGDGTATEVEVFAYIKVVKDQPNTTVHVEIRK